MEVLEPVCEVRCVVFPTTREERARFQAGVDLASAVGGRSYEVWHGYSHDEPLPEGCRLIKLPEQSQKGPWTGLARRTLDLWSCLRVYLLRHPGRAILAALFCVWLWWAKVPLFQFQAADERAWPFFEVHLPAVEAVLEKPFHYFPFVRDHVPAYAPSAMSLSPFYYLNC
eukprot:6395302-Amphidinium_carterae.1